MRTAVSLDRNTQGHPSSRIDSFGPVTVVAPTEWSRGNEAWCAEERSRSTDGTVQCAVCRCNCDALSDGAIYRVSDDVPEHDNHEDLVALCLNHSVMVERMFDSDPGWRGYADRSTAIRTIIKMLSGTGAPNSGPEAAQ